MIEKLKTINPYDETEIDMDANSVAGLVYENTPLVQKINELVDAFNIFDPEEISNQFHALSMAIKRLTERVEKLEKEHIADTSKKIPAPDLVEDYGYDLAENAQPDYVTTSYITDGYTKEYYGQNGASVITDHPLPAGYIITIREPETKGGGDE